MIIFFIKAALMSLLPFYRVDFPMDAFSKYFIYVEYDHGHELGRHAIKENDTAYAALKKLLSDEKQGWRYDLTTYAPNHTFSSPKLKINCLDNILVVNYQDAHNNWAQISKKNIGSFCPSVHLDREPSKAAK